MKAKKKTNHLLEQADKIEQIPEEKNDGREGQDEAIKAKKPRKNRFLARLRKAWARITGCMRCCCTSTQEERSAEELPKPSGLNMEEEFTNPTGVNMGEELSDLSNINMEEEFPEPSVIKLEDSKDTFFTAKVSAEVKDENAEENKNIKTDNEDAEVVETDSLVEQEIEAKHQSLHLIHSQENMYVQYSTSQWEILAEYNHIHDQITEDLHIQDYDGDEYDAQVKIKEDGEDGLEKADSTKESQRASCEMPGPSHVSSRDNESSKGKENENNKGEDNSIIISEDREECRSKQMSSSRSRSLEEESPEKVYKSIKTILDKYKASQSGSSQDEEPSTSDICLQKLVQPVEKTPSTVPLTTSQEAEVVETNSLVEQEIKAEYQHCLDLIHTQEDLYLQYYISQQEILAEYDRIHDQIQITKDLQIQDYDAEDEEEIPEEFYKSIKTILNKYKASQSGSSHDEEPSTSDISVEKLEEPGEETPSTVPLTLECSKSNSLEETPEKLYKTIKTFESGSSGNRSDSCLLEEEIPEEFYKSIKTILNKYKTSQSDSSHNEEPSTSDSYLEKLKQPDEETPSTVPLTLECFTFHQKLGEGGFAEVFLASDIIRKECVAIKVLSKSSFIEDGYSFVERNILELSHESPYLIHGLAAFQTETIMYYVMELATRGDLFHFMLKNLFPDTPIIQFIIAEVICGTQFLHKNNIIHRDLKPENILLTADGHMKLSDYGLSLMGVYEKTKEEPRGTPAYMAPEIVMNQEYGRGVDYFAIGVILYNLSTYQYPFPGDDDVTEVYHSILYHTPLYPEFLTPETVDILEGLLCKDQDYRLGVIGDIKQHQFFSDINWEDVEARRMEPPAIMTADFVDLNMDQTLDYMEMPNSNRHEDQKIFTEFSFVCPDWSQHYHPVNNEATQ